jgi:hypothetical protein
MQVVMQKSPEKEVLTLEVWFGMPIAALPLSLSLSHVDLSVR